MKVVMDITDKIRFFAKDGNEVAMPELIDGCTYNVIVNGYQIGVVNVARHDNGNLTLTNRLFSSDSFAMYFGSNA